MICAFGNPVYDRIKTPRVRTEGRVLSGCSTNFALALARLGRKVMLVGSIGKDFGGAFNAAMARYGIQTVMSEAPQTGGFALHYYDEHGNRTLDLIGQAAAIDFIPPATNDAEAVLVGPVLGETSFSFIRRLREACRGLFVLDPQGLVRGVQDGAVTHHKPKGIEEIIGLFDVVKPNEVECKVLTGIDPRLDARRAAELLSGWGPGVVIITLAEAGSVVYDGDRFWRVPAYPADCVDATGAGDTYAAGFVHGMLKGRTPPECAALGTAVASVMVEHVGPDFPLTGETVSARAQTLTATLEHAVPDIQRGV